MIKGLQESVTIEPRLLGRGDWGKTIKWERHLNSVAPPAELCSAVFCVAIKDNKIVLMRAVRGWGMLGGHIERDETIIEALHREALEEGGFIIDDIVLCGYRKIVANVPAPHPDPQREYPFPVSYIPFYLATSEKSLVVASGEEVLETASFTVNEIEAMQIEDWPVIKAVWDVFDSTQLEL